MAGLGGDLRQEDSAPGFGGLLVCEEGGEAGSHGDSPLLQGPVPWAQQGA